MSSARPAAALALLAVLAGCGTGLSGSGTPGSGTTVTPAPVPTAAESTGDTFAPGVDETGIYDADRLLDAHAAALANSSYTVRLSSVRRYPNGSLSARYDRVLRVAADGRFHYVLTTERPDGRDRRIERWRADGTAYTAITVGNDTTYRSSPRLEHPRLVTRSALVRLFRLVPSRVADERTRNGTTWYRVAGGPRTVPPLSNVSYVAILTEQGRIRSYRISYGTTRGESPRQVVVNASFSAVGSTTVDPPRRPATDESATGDGPGRNGNLK